MHIYYMYLYIIKFIYLDVRQVEKKLLINQRKETPITGNQINYRVVGAKPLYTRLSGEQFFGRVYQINACKYNIHR